MRAVVDAEQPRLVAAQRRDQRIAGLGQLLQLVTAGVERLGELAEALLQPVERPDFPLQRAADEGQEQVVDVELRAPRRERQAASSRLEKASG